MTRRFFAAFLAFLLALNAAAPGIPGSAAVAYAQESAVSPDSEDKKAEQSETEQSEPEAASASDKQDGESQSASSEESEPAAPAEETPEEKSEQTPAAPSDETSAREAASDASETQVSDADSEPLPKEEPPFVTAPGLESVLPTTDLMERGLIVPDLTSITDFWDAGPVIPAGNTQNTRMAAPNEAPAPSAEGMKVSKTAEVIDGETWITLEAYAPGKVIKKEIVEYIPTDIVFVLDQSTSMIGPMYAEYHEYHEALTNSYFYRKRDSWTAALSNVWVKLSDGSYAGVYLQQTQQFDPKTFQYTNQYIYFWNDNGRTEEARSWYDYGKPPIQLYYYDKATMKTKRDAMVDSLDGFLREIAEKSKGPDGTRGTSDDTHFRVALVGFGNDKKYLGVQPSPAYYEGTWLFTHNSPRSYRYLTPFDYGNSFVDFFNGAELSGAFLNNTPTDGVIQTGIHLGMEMAGKVFEYNPIKPEWKQNRVVVVLTDGAPGYDVFYEPVAVRALETSQRIKNQYGATVYTVGIFPNASTKMIVSPDFPKWAYVSGKSNWFMEVLSSNYGESRVSYTHNYDIYRQDNWIRMYSGPRTGNGYYLTASTPEGLNRIFQTIAKQIEVGESKTTLSEEAVLRDFIAPSFQIPPGTKPEDIVLRTYRYQGEGKEWVENLTADRKPDTMGARVLGLDGGKLEISGFDYSENFVATENGIPRGNKLTVRFRVEKKPGFLGGNAVLTNSKAGIYENSKAEKPVVVFPVPKVNVPIGDVAPSVKDKNVYYSNPLTVEEVRKGASVTVGGVTLSLDPAAVNYGLEEWQTAYVDIVPTLTDSAGNPVDYANLKEDQKYTLKVTVSPKHEPIAGEKAGEPAQAMSGLAEGDLRVFIPGHRYRPGEVYYGDAAPANPSGYLAGNIAGTEWKHGETEGSTVEMSGKPPKLALSFMPQEGRIVDGRIHTKKDFTVDVTTKIGAETVPTWSGENGGDQFVMRVKTAKLTISKTGGMTGEPYVFDILRNGEKYTEATISGNGSITLVELPVGTYSIAENEKWSWRFAPSYGENAVLSAKTPTGALTCSNEENGRNLWLNGYSDAVTNIFRKVVSGGGGNE